MPLVLAFVAIAGAALLLTSAIADASFADVIKGQAGALYRQHQAAAPTAAAAAPASSSTPSTSSPASTSSSGAPPVVSSSGYTNPLQHVTNWERTDQGVDANLPVGAPIVAPGRIKIMGVIPGWYNGQPLIWWQLLSGPDAGQYQYVAEQISNLAAPGSILNAGQTIATYAPSGTGIEYGWATASGATLAHATTGYVEGQITDAGRSIRNWLNALGAGAGPSHS